MHVHVWVRLTELNSWIVKSTTSESRSPVNVMGTVETHDIEYVHNAVLRYSCVCIVEIKC